MPPAFAPVTPAALVAAVIGGGAPVAAFLARQRWFAGKARGVGTVRLLDWAVLDEDGPLVLVLIDVDGERYFLPVSASDAPDAPEVIAPAAGGAVIEGHARDALARAMLEAIRERRDVPAQAGRFAGRAMTPWTGPAADAPIDVRPLSGEQSNTSIALGRTAILKSLRRPRAGVNPELEITQFLTERRFPSVPPLIGWMEYTHPAEAPSTVVVVEGFVDNQGDGWRHVLAALGRALDAGDTSGDVLLDELRELGRVTGALHAALTSDPDRPDFAPERITRDDARRWSASIVGALEGVTARLDRGSPELRDALARLRPSSAHAAAIGAGLDVLVAAGAHATRCHGDYHLGQVLKTRDSFVVIDFEGEPGRPIDERRAKRSPLVDVAGMLRSLSYAAHGAARARPEAERASELAWLERWEARAREALLDGYAAEVTKSPVRLAPESRADLRAATAPFEIDKACYELHYELDNRPDWVDIPLAGLARLLTR